MKKKVLIYLFALCSLTSFAQDKASLTKEETVNYLKKKINEIDGHYRTPGGLTNRLYFKNTSFDLDNNLLQLKTTRKNMLEEFGGNCGYFENVNITWFNPAHIKDIILVEPNLGEPVGLVKITLIGKVGRDIQEAYAYQKQNSNTGNCYNWERSDLKEYSVSEISIPFLATDPSNFNKMKKALEYLRDLYKAEDDPFGN
ncbi:hypothetical protein FBBAL38_10272 [Flavobacteria bacterium BAL38]|nr:hypothetical protein FBBAL38_10272 [Flavobacteria bacterium BAL38]